MRGPTARPKARMGLRIDAEIFDVSSQRRFRAVMLGEGADGAPESPDGLEDHFDGISAIQIQRRFRAVMPGEGADGAPDRAERGRPGRWCRKRELNSRPRHYQ